MENQIFAISAMVVPAILAITMHEAAHGWVAWILGDDTAKRLGRVTFNPLAHIDPVGTILLPALVYWSTGYAFGWAKPVPVNFARLNNPRRDMVLVALAGPGANFLLALLTVVLWRYLPGDGDTLDRWFGEALQASLVINAVLMVFNLLPIPPLDGGRVAVGILPRFLARPLANMERLGLGLLIGVIFILPLVAGQLGYNLNVMGWLLGPPVDWVVGLIIRLVSLL